MGSCALSAKSESSSANMLIKIFLLASCLVAGTFGQRRGPLGKLQEIRDKFEEIAEKVPYFISEDFKVGLMDICKDKDSEEVICVCKPKKPCGGGRGKDLSSEERMGNFKGHFKEMLLNKLSDPSVWPELQYEKKCRICRMRWTRCRDEDENCPEEAEDDEECDRPFRARKRQGAGRRRDRFN